MSNSAKVDSRVFIYRCKLERCLYMWMAARAIDKCYAICLYACLPNVTFIGNCFIRKVLECVD